MDVYSCIQPIQNLSTMRTENFHTPGVEEKYKILDDKLPDTVNTMADIEETEESSVIDSFSLSALTPLCGVIPFTDKGLETYSDAWAILQSARVDDERVAKIPPSRPITAGEVYVFALREDMTPNDWRNDGFQWINLRANPMPKKSLEPYMRRQDFRLMSNGEGVDFFKHEYLEYGPFWKGPIKMSEWKYPFVVLHYHGRFPINEAVNSVSSRKSIGYKKGSATRKSGCSEARKVASAVASIMDEESEIKNEDQNMLDESSPLSKRTKRKVFTESHEHTDIVAQALQVGQVIEISASSPDQVNVKRQKIVTRRNNRQNLFQPPKSATYCTRPRGKQTKAQTPSGKLLITKEDLFESYIFSESCPHVIRKMELADGVTIILASNSIVNHVNAVGTAIATLNTDHLNFHYETMYSSGKFYVSVLHLRHPFFDNEPCIPLAFMLHLSHNQRTHQMLFKTLKDLIPKLNSEHSDILVQEEECVKSAATEEMNQIMHMITTDRCSTLNSSPKVDFVLKTVLSSPFCDFSRLVYAAYFLQCHFLSQIKKTISGSQSGEFSLKVNYEIEISTPGSLASNILPIDEFEDALEPQEIISVLTKPVPPQNSVQKSQLFNLKSELQLTEGIARMFINKDRIEWHKSSGIFLVKGLGSKLYSVNLGDRTCTCLRGEKCEHLTAVQMGTGVYGKTDPKQ